MTGRTHARAGEGPALFGKRRRGRAEVPVRGSALVLVVLGAVGLADPAVARREPAPGGRIRIALDADEHQAFVDAHRYEPVVERIGSESAAARLARPPLPGFPAWRSRVLSGLEPSDGYQRWRLRSRVDPATLASALGRCFAEGAGTWSAAALSAAGVEVRAVRVDRHVELGFSSPVGPVPELLAGCALVPADDSASGPYEPSGVRELRVRPEAIDGPAPLEELALVPAGTAADLVGGSPLVAGGGTLVTPYPDVVVLLPSDPVRVQDPWGLVSESGPDPVSWGGGQERFFEELSGELLIAVYWAGRGSRARGLLPPGLAPARPLPESVGERSPLPLTLGPLPADAPSVELRHDADDPLSAGVVERLRVLLRSRGVASVETSATSEPLVDGAEVLRWRAPTLDPALALLALAGTRPILKSRVAGAGTADPNLLSPEPEERLAAALLLERGWLAERRIVPLVYAERWFAFDPRLRGLRVRPDGVPLVDEAYWSVRP